MQFDASVLQAAFGDKITQQIYKVHQLHVFHFSFRRPLQGGVFTIYTFTGHILYRSTALHKFLFIFGVMQGLSLNRGLLVFSKLQASSWTMIKNDRKAANSSGTIVAFPQMQTFLILLNFTLM